MSRSDKLLTASGVTTLNAICNEFRRRLKDVLLESGEPTVPAGSKHILDAAMQVSLRDLREQFGDNESDDIRPAA